MEEEEAFREIKEKNKFFFKRLFEDSYLDLVNYANKYLYNTDYSKDVVQDIFVQLWENADTIIINKNINAYLFKMVRNRCLNHLKSIKISDQRELLKTPEMEDVYATNSYLTTKERSADQLDIRKIVEKLPKRMGQIVKMRFIQDYTYPEIADELGVSVNTVKTQLKRAKIKISQLISVVVFFILQSIL